MPEPSQLELRPDAAEQRTIMSVPASTKVYQQIRHLFRNYVAVRDLVRNAEHVDPLPLSSIESVRTLIQKRSPIAKNPDTLALTAEAEQLLAQVNKAKIWLYQMVVISETYERATFYKIFREAVELNDWSECNTFWMFVADADVDDPIERLKVTLAHVYYNKMATRLAHLLNRRGPLALSSLARPVHSPPSPQVVAARARAGGQCRTSKVDAFCSAVPLSIIKRSGGLQDHKCPVCREPYADFENYTTGELLADYPVKIKYCGHIFGKQCLENWLSLQLHNPAKQSYYTCPMCREQVTERKAPSFVGGFVRKFEESEHGMAIKRQCSLRYEECKTGVKRLINEEIALWELLRENESADEGTNEELRHMLLDFKKEKDVWGISRKHWREMKVEWRDEVRARSPE